MVAGVRLVAGGAEEAAEYELAMPLLEKPPRRLAAAHCRETTPKTGPANASNERPACWRVEGCMNRRDSQTGLSRFRLHKARSGLVMTGDPADCEPDHAQGRLSAESAR